MMKTKYLFIQLLLLAWIASLTACAQQQGSQTPQYTTKWGQQVVFHTFEFDALRDSKDIEVLDYLYKTANENITGNPFLLREKGKALQYHGETGVMTVGETLYVKWKIKSTGEVIEKSIDLRPILPKSMKDKTLHFILEKQDIYIYTISHQPVRENFTPEVWTKIHDSIRGTRIVRLSFYAAYEVNQIYPTREVIFPYIPKK